MWQLDLMPAAVLDMSYVTVKYSDARAHPVGVPTDVIVYTLTVYTVSTELVTSGFPAYLL